MSDDHGSSGERPEYKVYRSRPKLLGGRDAGIMDELRDRQEERPPVRDGDGGRPPRPPREQRAPREQPPEPQRGGRRRPSVRKILRYAVLAVVGWVLISFVLFMVSAQIERRKVTDSAAGTLQGAGFTLTSPNTILILGSDQRTKGLAEPGSSTTGPSRSDSIMLMRIGGGANATLSIPRDTVVDIPGHGPNKINAAYAFGGPALAVTTVERFLGIPVNHLVEVNFENFPQLIDALGGVTVKTGCVISRINGGTANGGYTLKLKRGKHELSGKQALALARTRKNDCNAAEDDRTRAHRQQLILAAMKRKVISLETFARLPWVSWTAPKAVRSDMAGPSLLGIVGASLIGGKAHQQVLKPNGGVTLPDGGAALTVDPAEVRHEVRRFLRG